MSYGVEQLLQQRSDIDSELKKHKSPVTVMFTDLAGSTSYFERHGDTAGVEWLESHNAIVCPVVQQHGGTVVKTIGDSVMAYFTQAGQATAAAREIQQKLLQANSAAPESDSQMFVRVALHQGLGYLRGGDVFGDVVNTAARLAKLCLPAQILLSEAVYLTVQGQDDLQFNPLGTQQLRGKSGKESLYELAWTDEESYARLRKRFPPKTAAQQEDLSEGRYQVLGEIGRGAMGVVYKAYDRVIGRVVAMKTIPLEVGEEEREPLIARLKQEARACGILDHPNLITVFDVGEEGGLFYFTMQYVEGETLAARIERKELIPLSTILELMDQICSAVSFAHKAGIIHRDLKPSNLMLTNVGAAKVLDFGIAKLGEAALTRAGMIIGTPSYLSPEQAGGRRIDHRSDIFSLGAVLYELLTGEKAFAGESTTTVIFKVLNEDPIPVSAIEPSLPPGLDAVVRKALAKDPNQRYQSCQEMREALRNCRTAPVDATFVSKPMGSTGKIRALEDEKQESSASGSKLWVAAGAVALVLAVAGGIVVWSRSNKPQVPTQAPAQVTAPVTTPAGQAPASSSLLPTSAAAAETKAGEGKSGATSTAPIVTSPVVEATRVPSKTAPAKNERAEAPEMSVRSIRAARKAARAAETRTAQEEQAPASADTSGMYSRGDIPSLLARADGYAGRGDYHKAIILYGEILHMDGKNEAARDGMRRAREAQGMRR